MLAAAPPIKVLLVEDDERLAGLTRRYLEGTGFAVAWVASGLRALEDAVRNDHDVIRLDLLLPGRDGVDVCRELRTRLHVPIIMVTARREEADRVLGLEAGADDYVPSCSRRASWCRGSARWCGAPAAWSGLPSSSCTPRCA